MAFPSPVQNYHTDTYAAIDPTSPRLSTKGKNIVITGGGSGIGSEIAKSFAKSGASTISILGRTEKTLLQTKAWVEKTYPQTKAYYYVADIADGKVLDKVFQSIKSTVGLVDVLVANAGYLPDIQPIADGGIDEWFRGFEVNVKGSFNLVNAFVPVAAPNASVVNLSTGVVHLPYVPGYSSYHTSKLAATKLFDYIHYEHPEFFVLNVHPGVLETAMYAKSKAAGTVFPLDKIALPADFTVWAVSPEARFLNGKLVWAHWDVDELKAMEEKIVGTDKFTLGLLGWP